jgi:hypothetical protein
MVRFVVGNEHTGLYFIAQGARWLLPILLVEGQYMKETVSKRKRSSDEDEYSVGESFYLLLLCSRNARVLSSFTFPPSNSCFR